MAPSLPTPCVVHNCLVLFLSSFFLTDLFHLTFLPRARIMFSMKKLSTADRVRVVAALVEGCSVRSTCRMTGVALNTVLKLVADLGEACQAFHDVHVRNLGAVERVQCDEICCFVGAKEKNTDPS